MTNPLWNSSSPHNARLLREQLGIDEGDHDDYDQKSKQPPQMDFYDKADELYQRHKEGDL